MYETNSCTSVHVATVSHDDHGFIFAFWTYHVTSACTYLTGTTQIHHCLDLRPLKPTRCPPSTIPQVLCIDLHHSQCRSLQKSVILYKVRVK